MQVIGRTAGEESYERQVFLVRDLGFCELTRARRISSEVSLVFEKIHEEGHRAFGHELTTSRRTISRAGMRPPAR